MATMFPAENETFTTAGEETVYRFLRRAARPDAVFLAWYSPDIEDREPDFILLSPDSGLIVLEVKDWLAEQVIEADPKSALLQIGPRQERRKQPLAQAREYVNSLLSLLGRRAPEDADLAGADGPEPRWLESADGRAQVEDVAEGVAGLVRAGIAMSEIAVLYVRNRSDGVGNLAEALVVALEARGVLARWAARDTASKRGYDITTDSVTISTIHSAKGLDYAQVFLLGLDDLSPDDEKARRLAHVGVTRAREGLTLSTTREGGLAAALKATSKGETQCKNS